MNIELEMPSYEIAQITDLSVALEPVQENDYDSVWPAGGGKNKYPILVGNDVWVNNGSATHSTGADGSLIINTSSSSSYSGVYLDTNSATMASVLSSFGSDARTISMDVVASASGTVRLTSGNTQTWTIGTTKQRISIVSTATGCSIYGVASGATLTVSNVQIEAGSTATDFSPYYNICPITGHSEVTVTRTGKNLADGSYPSQYNEGQYDLFLAYLQQGTYTLSTGRHERMAIYVRKSATPIYGGDYIAVSYNASPCRFTVSESGWYFAHAYRTAAYPTREDAPITNVQLELGSTATAYEPYQAQEYTIDLDGTIYGGTLDVLSGVLTVEWENIDSYAGETLPGKWISDRDVYASGTTPTTGAQVAYELATPITVQLTAQDVETLTGINNVWSDSGNVSVTIYGTTQTGDVVTVTALPQHKIQLFMP